MLCLKCNKPISGAHIDIKGKLYHIECVGGDACAKCGKPVNNMSIQAADRMWHPECFLCSNCNKLLRDTFVRKETEIWCKECYSAELICNKCNLPVGGQYITTKNKKFHSECFNCFSCNSSLGTDYFDIDGQFQCDSCYNKSLGCCQTCSLPLTGLYVSCLGKMYHENCFVCWSCKTPLDKKFYSVNGYPHCLDCAKN